MTAPLILISLDAVRPDHLSCYGYKRIQTANIDEIAKEGILFEDCITASCLTPVSMASVITGMYPNKHGLRDPFTSVRTKTITEFFKGKGYATAGFVGIDLLSARRGLGKGFDTFKEPTEEVGWHTYKYKNGKGKWENTIWGYWWVDELLDFIEENSKRNFFVWGHYFETHVAAERWLLSSGFIEENVLSERDYYDAKIKCADEKLFGPLIKLLKEKGLWDNATIIVMSDHGETFDEHSHKNAWPQHQSMYNTDLKNVLIIKNRTFKKGIKIKNKVRTIDLLPTILDIYGEEPQMNGFDCDGESLKPVINDSLPTNRVAYSEEIYEQRGAGILQAIQDEQFKLIRNLSTKIEEFYCISSDPLEQNNLINSGVSKETINNFRKQLDALLVSKHSGEKNTVFEKEEVEAVKKRLKSLGYI